MKISRNNLCLVLDYHIFLFFSLRQHLSLQTPTNIIPSFKSYPYYFASWFFRSHYNIIVENYSHFSGRTGISLWLKCSFVGAYSQISMMVWTISISARHSDRVSSNGTTNNGVHPPPAFWGILWMSRTSHLPVKMNDTRKTTLPAHDGYLTRNQIFSANKCKRRKHKINH